MDGQFRGIGSISYDGVARYTVLIVGLAIDIFDELSAASDQEILSCGRRRRDRRFDSVAIRVDAKVVRGLIEVSITCKSPGCLL